MYIFAWKNIEIMERLIRISNDAIRRTSTVFSRYIAEEIDWGNQLIGISGARGCGKTTLLIQHLKSIPAKNKALYVSLDDIYFTEKKLIYFAEDFHKMGGEYLFLDEVHKYPNWSQEIKNIYDSLPGIKVVFTSSSALEIYKGTHDLSRRALIYHLPGLSFREFLEFKYKIILPKLTLKEILYSHTESCDRVMDVMKPLPMFNEYIKTGYYPFFKNTGTAYLKQLMNTVNLVVESDLPAIYRIDFNSIIKIKKLLSIISKITPYTPNIEELARQVGCTRDTLLKYLYYLDKAKIIKWLGRDKHGINYMTKPEKLYLGDTNIAYALGDPYTNTGSIRETFFLNQVSVKHTVTYPKKADFMVDGKLIFEIGGKNKSKKQIEELDHAYIIKDNIEYGFGNTIPLWLFGFMY